jgi:hypothetical protein
VKFNWILRLFFVITACASALPVAAQEKVFPDQLNLSAPSSAALDILGVAASKATTPTSLQKLVLGLVNSFDQNGLFKNGFAFNGCVYQIQRSFNWSDLHKDSMLRSFAFTNLSLAGVRGTGDDKSGRAALSLSIPLVNKTDWRFDKKAEAEWQSAVGGLLANLYYPPLNDADPDIPRIPARGQVVDWLRGARVKVQFLTGDDAQKTNKAIQVLSAALERMPANLEASGHELEVERPQGDPAKAWHEAWTELFTLKQIPGQPDQYVGKLANLDAGYVKSESKKIADALVKQFDEEHWNDQKFDVALAYAWFTPDASSKGLVGEGAYAIASYAMPLRSASRSWGQITLYGKSATKDRTWDKNTKTWTLANTLSFGGRLRGGSSSGGMFVEYLQTKRDPLAGSRKTDQILQGGYEHKLGDGQWLQVSLGKGSGAYSTTLFGLNWTISLGGTRYLDEHGAPSTKVGQ